jgi:hypothetical protein
MVKKVKSLARTTVQAGSKSEMDQTQYRRLGMDIELSRPDTRSDFRVVCSLKTPRFPV